MSSSRRIRQYQLGDSIGNGAFGTVYRGLNIYTGEVVAIKQIKVDDFATADELNNAHKEIDMLKNLNHPNIVKYLGCEQTDAELDIILELCEGGSLKSILRRFGKFPENLVGVYVAQILEGLAYLHRNAVVHRDIKPENILTTKQGKIKLADFGVAKFQDGNATVAGSPYWMAPEVIQLNGATTASDIWSLGCTIVQLVDGKAPYQDLPPMAALFRIGQDEHPPFPSNISKLLRDFLSHCLVRVDSARATAEELLKHPWITACQRELAKEHTSIRPDSPKSQLYTSSGNGSGSREISAVSGRSNDSGSGNIANITNNSGRQVQGEIKNAIQIVERWNRVVQNSSPRDVKRYALGSAHTNISRNINSRKGISGHGPSDSTSSENMHPTHGSEERLSSCSNIGINNSVDNNSRRTVSSIAYYEEDSDDDWENAFESLENLHIKTQPKPTSIYPQAIISPLSPADAASIAATAFANPRSHSHPLGIDDHETRPTIDRSSSVPHHQSNQSNDQVYIHTSPSSPSLCSPENPADRLSKDLHGLYIDSSHNQDYQQQQQQNRYHNQHHYQKNHHQQQKRNSIQQKNRSSLGLIRHKSDDSSSIHSTSTHNMDNEEHETSIDSTTSGVHESDTSVVYSTNDNDSISISNKLADIEAASVPLEGEEDDDKSNDLFHIYDSREVEERLRRETELKWVNEVGTEILSLRGAVSADEIEQHATTLMRLLRDGSGVFSPSSKWCIRILVEVIQHHILPNVQKSILLIVNRLCHMDDTYLLIFCLHGILPLLLSMIEKSATDECGSEALRFIDRLCRAAISPNTSASGSSSTSNGPLQMLLACNGVSSLCLAFSRVITSQGIESVSNSALTRIINSLNSLAGFKVFPGGFNRADLGDLMLKARVHESLTLLFATYGAACQPPTNSPEGSVAAAVAERQYHIVRDTLSLASRLFYLLISLNMEIETEMCQPTLLSSIFHHMSRFHEQAILFVLNGVRRLSKNPLNLEPLDTAGIFSVCDTLLKNGPRAAYRDYVMAIMVRICNGSPERQTKLATHYIELVEHAIECAASKESRTATNYGRCVILDLANGGPQCCKVLKHVKALELIVKLISRERWCGMAIRALLAWTKTVPSDIVPILTAEGAEHGWVELAQPLFKLYVGSPMLDLYVSTFYQLVRVGSPRFSRACMSGHGSERIWMALMDRYLAHTQFERPDGSAIPLPLSGYDVGSVVPMGSGANGNGIVERMNPTTRLSFLNLLILLQPHLKSGSSRAAQTRISSYFNSMIISAKLDPALPVRKASSELSGLLGRM